MVALFFVTLCSQFWNRTVISILTIRDFDVIYKKI